jgi:hypothetical protein
MAITNAFKTALKGRAYRRSKLGIPRVNPDPRPPNEPRGNKGRDNQSKNRYGNVNSINKPKAGQKNKPGNNGKPGGSSPTQQDQPTKVEPLYGNAIDPRDSEYWRNLVVLTQNKDNQLSQLNTEETYSRTAYERALQDLTLQQPRDELSYREGANQAGAFYSSKTGEGLGQIKQEYFLRRSDTEQNFNKEQSLRELMRRAIEQGYTAEEAALLAEATERQAMGELDREAPYIDPISTKVGKPKKKPPKKTGGSSKGTNKGSKAGSGGGGKKGGKKR